MSTETDQLDETALVLFPDALGHPFRQTGTLQAGPLLYGGRGGVVGGADALHDTRVAQRRKHRDLAPQLGDPGDELRAARMGEHGRV